jgi:ribose transport system permease protein
MMNAPQAAANSVPTNSTARSRLPRFPRWLSRHSYLFALLLLVIAVAINYSLQSNLFELRVLNGNLRVFLPLAIVAAGQAIVVIGGGIDLSVGAMVSLVNTILVTQLNGESTPEQVVLVFLLGCGAGALAGAFNGFFVAFLRLQPIVTTYATSFVFSGLALLILPRPGGTLPSDVSRLYRSTPAEIPFVLYMMVLLGIIWLLLRSTRFGQFLYATGGKPDAAYATGVPVNRVRFTTYVLSGLFSALGAIALTMSISTGNSEIGVDMTLDSIVAVVLGGTRLSGGQGGVIGPIIGVVILGVIRNIISFADVLTWSQTLVDALIIIFALAGPGIFRLLRGLIQSRVRR